MDAKRVVLVHDWLTGMRGGEKCLEVLCRRFPEARLLTLLHQRGSVSETIERLKPRTSLLGWLPGVARYYRYLLPLMPLAARTWRTGHCDLVVSFSHCVAKAVIPPPGVPHVCYCFTPMRYAWHMEEAYFGKERGLKAWLRRQVLDRLRAWDKATASRVTHFVAISKTIQRRITECYGRDSVVIYPPVDTDFYTPAPVPREDFYLCVSACAPYKRLDLAIAACNRLGRKLVLIGSGQDLGRLRSLAGPTVTLLGWQSDEVIRDHLRRCRALLFPGEEDFGIVPLEAHATGAPVLALDRGGATETILGLDSATPTGLLFAEQSEAGLIDAIETFERRRGEFAPEAARRQALRFSRDRFEAELVDYLETVVVGGQPARRAA
jgi:glycosyltransferase involved in cell wall biosynthesis